MQTFNTYYTTASEFSHFVHTRNIEDSENILIQIFTSLKTENDIALLLHDISTTLPQAYIIGATTDGEIVRERVTTNSTVISLTLFEKTTLRTSAIFDCQNSKENGVKIAQALIDEDTKLIITFTDGLHCNGEEYLKGIHETNPHIKVAGGMAGDGARFEETYVFTKDCILSNGAVGVSLSNKELQIFTDYSFNWLSIGKEMTITRAEQNRVYTINGISAYEIYKKYLGEETALQLPSIGIEYPLVMTRDNVTVARAVLASHEDGSLTFAGNLAEGDIVHFGYGDALCIIDYSLQSQKKLLNQSVESIFIYSCMARRRFMPELIEKEIAPFSKIAPTTGFFTYGEFFSTKEDSELLNQSMTVLALSESVMPIKKIACIETSLPKLNDYQKSIQALSHLLGASIKDLNEENDKLKNEKLILQTKKDSLDLAQSIGHFGSLDINLLTKEAIWSKESYNIYKVDKSVKPTLDNFLNRILDEDKPKATKVLEEMRDGKIKRVELRTRRDDGVIIHVLLTGKMLFNETGVPVRMIGTTLDITELYELRENNKEKTELLNHQAHHDYLTNLPNRLFFEERLEQAIAHVKQKYETFALLFIDLDNFKEINDTLGHHIGDKVLQQISKKLSTCMRVEDTLSRTGGDEFTVILQNSKNSSAVAGVAQKMLDIINMKLTIDNHEIYLSASIGITLCPKDSLEKNDIIKFADSAMYKAKENGKNSYEFYSNDMTQLTFERVLLQNSMRTAIHNEEFVVYYQPQIDVRNKKLTGMEALVRWKHPSMGLISPIKFIPLAEESGFIVQLDSYVMRSAMKDFVHWYALGLNPGVLSLNLSIKQLNNSNFIIYLIQTATELGFNLHWLELEVTETQMMQDPLSSIEKLQTISDIGIKISIDDFGTGYSSLAYLKRLPVDKLKIDKSFVDNLPDDDEDCAISKAVIALAKSLDLKIIAEGVETKEQKDFLMENGCENIQGYYYSPAISKERMELFLQQKPYM